jgi:arginase
MHMTQASSEDSKLALIGFPYDANSSFLGGAAQAPAAIRQALYSDSTSLWTEGGIDLGADGSLTDRGDVPLSAENFPDAVEEAVTALYEDGLRALALGGDHSITYPIVRSMSRRCKNLMILHFDAHPDLYADFRGNPYSHASPFARIMEEQLSARLVQVGVRTLNAHQRAQAELYHVEIVEMRNLGATLTCKFEGPLYVSIDMDVLDPAFAPGVSHHEPGGLTTRQLIEMIQSIKAEIVGADLVEFNPTRDPLGITAMACAKILKELAARMLMS